MSKNEASSSTDKVSTELFEIHFYFQDSPKPKQEKWRSVFPALCSGK
jgi:hypothetical protein